MHLIKNRFVTACQQLLALAVVLAVLAPAAGVVNLDLVEPGSPRATGSATFAAYAAESAQASLVPTEQVAASVSEHTITPAEAAEPAAPGAEQRETAAGGHVVTSEPQEVEGYGAIGVTWDGEGKVADDEIALRARTLTDGEWSEWTELVYHDEHGPDPASPEADAARPGTDELLVGEVDEVQVQASTTPGTELPADMKLAVVDPGEAEHSEMERAAIDTSQLPSSGGAAVGTTDEPATDEPATDEPATDEPATDGLALQAATFTPRPTIYSRAQWGANEKLRDAGSLRYHEVHAGFVHHTVNANNYTRAEVPGILRSIYAYHTKSRGWSDLGYNYLVDRFGRIWEGRAGGVDRAVVGAHTQGYNDHSFAMSAIGNFETAKPTSAMVQAYGALFAWKLSLHGVAAGSKAQRVGKRSFQAISGHRDAGSTACPGKHLYARIGDIRKLAAGAQKGWTGRELESNLADTAHPDLVLRRASDKRLFVQPTRGLTSITQTTVSTGWSKYTAAVASPDLTGDRRPDMIVQNKAGTVAIRPGLARGGYGTAVRGTKAFRGMSLITPVGDLNRDGRNDVVALHRANTRLYLYLGRGNGAFKRVRLARGWSMYNLLAATGDLNGDGYVDLLGRDSAGGVWLHPGNRTGRFGTRVRIATGWKAFDSVTGFGDFNQDGRNDLFARNSDGRAFVLPGTGAGRFGTALGPLSGAAGVRGLSSGGSVTGTGDPDLVGRRGDALVVLRHGGTTELGRLIDTGRTAPGATQLLNVGDWDRDGDGDVMFVTASGALRLLAGDGRGRLAAARTVATGLAGVKLLTAVGDITGDGWPDLMGQPAGSGMRIYPGRGAAGLAPSFVAHRAISGTVHVGVGRWDGDGAPDTLVRAANQFTLYRSNGPGGLLAGTRLAVDLSAYDWVIGIRDIAITGHADVVARQKLTGRLYLLPGTATGFGAARYLGGGMAAYDLAD